MPLSWSLLLALVTFGGVVAGYGVVTALAELRCDKDGGRLRAPESPSGHPVGTLRLTRNASTASQNQGAEMAQGAPASSAVFE